MTVLDTLSYLTLVSLQNSAARSFLLDANSNWWLLLAPALPGHVAAPYSYAATHGSRANSIINVVTVAEMTGDNTIKVQHQVSYYRFFFFFFAKLYSEFYVL